MFRPAWNHTEGQWKGMASFEALSKSSLLPLPLPLPHLGPAHGPAPRHQPGEVSVRAVERAGGHGGAERAAAHTPLPLLLLLLLSGAAVRAALQHEAGEVARARHELLRAEGGRGEGERRQVEGDEEEGIRCRQRRGMREARTDKIVDGTDREAHKGDEGDRGGEGAATSRHHTMGKIRLKQAN